MASPCGTSVNSALLTNGRLGQGSQRLEPDVHVDAVGSVPVVEAFHVNVGEFAFSPQNAEPDVVLRSRVVKFAISGLAVVEITVKGIASTTMYLTGQVVPEDVSGSAVQMVLPVIVPAPEGRVPVVVSRIVGSDNRSRKTVPEAVVASVSRGMARDDPLMLRKTLEVPDVPVRMVPPV